MDCRTFEDQLDEFEAGIMPAQDQAAADAHLSLCARCSALHAFASGSAHAPDPGSSEEIVSSVLRITTGPACAVVQEQLCVWIDGCLAETDSEMLSVHVTHCPGCSALAASLSELRDLLPTMATVEPDAAFTEDVVRVTSGHAETLRFKRYSAPKAGLWQQLVCRPRFAWETAYVGALLLFLILGNPYVLSKCSPRAVALRDELIRGGDRVLQTTSSVVAERQGAAQESLDKVFLGGKAMLAAAADVQTRTSEAVRRHSSAFFVELKQALSEAEPPAPDRRQLR